MRKRLPVKLLASFLALTLLSFNLISLSYNEAPSFASNKNTILSAQTAASTSGTSEPCEEEKEGKDSSIESHTMEVVPSTHEYALSRLMANLLREKNKSVSSFGNTTNLPIYIAKRSFLI